MSFVPLAPEPIPGFKVQMSVAGKACVMQCSGTIDSPDSTSTLQPMLLQLHDRLVAAGVETVRLDVSGMEYMNSSAIKCFMAWFLKAERSKDASYAITVVFDKQRTWQYVSFTTMGRVAPRVLKTHALNEQAS